MTDETNAVAAAVAQPELKSTDTRTSDSDGPNITVRHSPKPEPKPEAKPEAKPAVEAVKPPEGESDAPDADSPQGKEKRLPRWMKERLERERQVTEARTREAVTRELLDRQQPAAKPQPTQAEPQEKTLQDFDFDQDKYIAYRVERAIERKESAVKQEAEQRKQAETVEKFNAKVDAFEEKVGDGAWEDIKASKLNLDPAYKGLVDIIQGDDNDLEVFHHLATNMKEAERINALPRLQQVREIAKLAEQFEGGEKEEIPKPVVAKKTTSAPPPVKTISGAGKPSVDINDPGMSTADRIKAWKKQGGR